MTAKIVHDDNISWPESGNEKLFDIGLERFCVNRPVEHQRRDHAGESQTRHESRRFPVSVGRAGSQAFTFWGPAPRARHVGRGPGLVNKNETFGIEIELSIEPGLAPFQNIGAVLFARVSGLF